MPTLDAYAAITLSFSGPTVTLRPTFNPTTRIKLVISDDDNFLDGDLLDGENGNDTNQFGTAIRPNGTTAGGPTTRIFSEEHYTLTAPGQPTIMLYRVEVDAPTGDGILVGFVASAPLTPGLTYDYVWSNTVDSNAPTYDSLSSTLCLTTDSRVATFRGERPAGRLRPGDLVRTRDHGFQAIRWIGIQRVDAAGFAANPKLRPVRIAAGALGSGIPRRDLIVSRQHRMLVSSRIARRLLGVPEVLIPAIRLVGLPGITIDETATQVAYVHLLFDRHEIIFAERAPTESLFTGPEALATIPADSLEEIFTLFPMLRDQDHRPAHALPVPENRQQKRLIERHARSGRPLLETYQTT